jgi:hypothetical protein
MVLEAGPAMLIRQAYAFRNALMVMMVMIERGGGLTWHMMHCGRN